MTVTSSLPRLWIKASPRGTRSGFAVLPDGAGGRVTVTVLPKAWSSKPRIVHDYTHSPGTTTHVVLHETELAALRTSVESIGALTMSLADTGRDQSDLLALGAPSDDPLREPIGSVDPFGQLIDLMLLAERGSLMDSPLTFEGTFAPSLLRLLTHERLLALVEELIFRARPRYAERTETLEMPRGRLSAKSLLLSIATGTPRVESTFDDLTTDTPLLQVVASALRVVGSDRLPPKIAALRPGLQIRAVHLLRHLSSVTLLERERALLAAERLWVGPLDLTWKPAVDAALPVLRDWAVSPEDESGSTDAILVQVSTEKFWEQCLEIALSSCFANTTHGRDVKVGRGVSVPSPWVNLRHDHLEPPGASLPDYMFKSGGVTLVADAKYKMQENGKPSSSDSYQMFAYSHLAQLDGIGAMSAGLIYPSPAGIEPRQDRLTRMRSRDMSLWLIHVPFPSSRDLRDTSTWSAYIANVAESLMQLSDDWLRQADTAAAQGGGASSRVDSRYTHYGDTTYPSSGSISVIMDGGHLTQTPTTKLRNRSTESTLGVL